MRLHLPRSTLFISVLLLADNLSFLCSMCLVVGIFCSRRVNIHIYNHTCRHIWSIYTYIYIRSIHTVQIQGTGNRRKESHDNITIPSTVPVPNPTKVNQRKVDDIPRG